METFRKFLLLAAISVAFACQSFGWPSAAVYSDANKISSHLYEVTFEDYDYGYANVYMSRTSRALEEDADIEATPVGRPGGCSICRNGNFIGRNFDWLYSEVDEFVIRVVADPKKQRHASIGIATPAMFVIGQPIPDGSSDTEYEALPFFTMDGINDSGVFCACNLMDQDDEEFDQGTRLKDPAAREICEAAVVRFVLDYANSADEAVSLMGRLSIRNLQIAPIVWVVADAYKTYVVEIVGNELKVIPRGKTAALTNFYLSKSPVCGRKFAPGAGGVERYDRLTNGLEVVDSQRRMLDWMKTEFYSQCYIPGNELKWWSEMNGTQYEDESGVIRKFSYYDPLDTTSYAFKRRMEEFASDRTKLAFVKMLEAMFIPRFPTELWHTIHSSSYDLNRQTFEVRVQEEDEVFSFAL